ncbi:MAG: hypothetical protein QW626_04630 [Candidatus Hadarchaeales archaeon]
MDIKFAVMSALYLLFLPGFHAKNMRGHVEGFHQLWNTLDFLLVSTQRICVGTLKGEYEALRMYLDLNVSTQRICVGTLKDKQYLYCVDNNYLFPRKEYAWAR